MLLWLAVGTAIGFVICSILLGTGEALRYYSYEGRIYKLIGGDLDKRCRHDLDSQVLHQDFARWYNVRICRYCSSLWISTETGRVYYES